MSTKALAALVKALAPERAVPSFMARAMLSALAKGKNHKYLRRVPIPGKLTKTGKQRYRYFYRTIGGKGLGHHDEMQVGAAFKMKDGGSHGHFEVTHDHGDGHLTVRHDETGTEHKIHRDTLATMLHREHAEVRKEDDAKEAAKREKAKKQALADLEESKKHGSAKHVEAARKRAVAAGHVSELKKVTGEYERLSGARKQAEEDERKKRQEKAAAEAKRAEEAKQKALENRPVSLADDHPKLVKLKEAMGKAAPLPSKPIDAHASPTAKEANLKRLQGFVSKDKTRPALHGVHADGKVAVATDGHRLVVAPTTHKAEREFFPDHKHVMPKKDDIASSHSFDGASLHALAEAAIAHDKARESGSKGTTPRVSFHRTADGAVHAAIGVGSDRDGKVAPGVKVVGKTHQAPEDDHLESDGGGIHLNAHYLKEALAGHKGHVTVNFNKDTARGPVDIHRTDGERHIIMPTSDGAAGNYGSPSKGWDKELARRNEARKKEQEAKEAQRQAEKAKQAEEKKRHDEARDAAKSKHGRNASDHDAAALLAHQKVRDARRSGDDDAFSKWSQVGFAHERAASAHRKAMSSGMYANEKTNYFEDGPAAHALSEKAHKLQAEAPEPKTKAPGAPPPSHEEMVQRFKSAGYDGEHPDRLKGELSKLHDSLAEQIAEHLVETDDASYNTALEEAHEQLDKVLKDATPPEAKARKKLDLDDVDNDEPHIKGHANLVHEGAELHDHGTGEVHKVVRMDKDGVAHFKDKGPGGKSKMTRAELSSWFGDGKTKTIRPDEIEQYANHSMDKLLSRAVSKPEDFIPYAEKELKPGREVHTHDGEVFTVSEGGKLEDDDGKEHDPDDFDFQHGKAHILPSEAELEAKKKQIPLALALRRAARILAKGRRR